jgi:hypothetical protein
MASGRQLERKIQSGKRFSALSFSMSFGETDFPALKEVKMVALKAKPLPIARNYGTPVPTMHVVFKMELAIRKPLTPWSVSTHWLC